MELDPKVFPEVLDFGRVVLRKHTLDLALTMFKAVDRDRERLRVFLPWVDAIHSIADEIAYIKLTHERWDQGSLFDYSVFERTAGTYLGNAGVHHIAWGSDRCEFGYWILGAFEGRGYVSEAVQALERHCFGIGFHRVEIRCSSANERSASIPLRLGYQLEGVLREDTFEGGRYRDTKVFGKLNQSSLTSIT